MHNLKIWILFSSLLMGSAACHGDQEEEPVDRATVTERSRVPPRLIQQVPPPLDLQEPPTDAMKTASGLVYTKLSANESGTRAQPKDSVLVHYTGWRQGTGETFFTTRARGRPIAIDVAHAAPGFAEALPLLRKGEKVVMWVPSGQGTTETLVYEVEVVDVAPPSAVAHRASPRDASSRSSPYR